MHLPEDDWKYLRVVHRAALERYCEHILRECTSIAADSSHSAHERYLTLFRHLQDRNNELAAAFDDMRRSRAIDRLLAMRGLGLVTEDEWAGFSSETRERVASIEREMARR